MQSRYFIYSLLTLLIFSGGCKKFVEVGSPYTLTTTDVVYSDPASATAALTGVYTQMTYLSVPFNIARRTGAYADELTSYAVNSAGSTALYYNIQNANTNIGSWTEIYPIIYQANAVLAGLQGKSAISDPVKQQLTGEAEFSRAFLYFYLVNLYGDVPLILTTAYNQNSVAARASTDQVYNQMIADCKDAIDKLNDNFVDGTSVTTTSERTRPTKSAARALLARIYLYRADYTDAADQATAVIGNSLFGLDALTDIFLKNSKESIWQLEKPSNLSFTSEGYNFILQYYISTYGDGQSAGISPQLMNAFETGDNRYAAWIGTYVDFTGITYYFPYKYKEGYTNTPTEYPVVLRLAEQYLIRAEALARQGKLTDAVADLDMIRLRAGLSGYAGTMDQPSLLAAILHERQIELFSEWGHRWFDLKRTGNADAVMTVVTPLKGGGSAWAPFLKLWPVPQSDRTLDPHLTQNAGY